MSPIAIQELVVDSRTRDGLGGPWNGVYPALVLDVRDPDAQGRVRITLPWSPDQQGRRYEAWARMATLMAGSNRGSWFLPDCNDEVLVAFEAGDPRRPYVVGALWNGVDSPPESMDARGNNNRKVLRSRNGVQITLDDQNGQETLVLETPGGQKVTMQDGPGRIRVEDSNGNSILLGSTGITINASAKVTVNASSVAISAGMMTVDAGMSKFSGVVQADTLIANSVVSSSYTPGAGNVW